MSNVFRDQCSFFTVPHELVDAGHLRDLSEAAIKLYLVLVALAQKHSAIAIQLPAYKVHDYTGLQRKSVIKAGRELAQAKLVRLDKTCGAVMTYNLLNPVTGSPLPAPEGRRGIHYHRPSPGRSARTIEKLRKAFPKDTAPEPDNVSERHSTCSQKTQRMFLKDTAAEQNPQNAGRLAPRLLSEKTLNEGISEKVLIFPCLRHDRIHCMTCFAFPVERDSRA